jgi:hypothetical protein
MTNTGDNATANIRSSRTRSERRLWGIVSFPLGPDPSRGERLGLLENIVESFVSTDVVVIGLP